MPPFGENCLLSCWAVIQILSIISRTSFFFLNYSFTTWLINHTQLKNCFVCVCSSAQIKWTRTAATMSHTVRKRMGTWWRTGPTTSSGVPHSPVCGPCLSHVFADTCGGGRSGWANGRASSSSSNTTCCWWECVRMWVWRCVCVCVCVCVSVVSVASVPLCGAVHLCFGNVENNSAQCWNHMCISNWSSEPALLLLALRVAKLNTLN